MWVFHSLSISIYWFARNRLKKANIAVSDLTIKDSLVFMSTTRKAAIIHDVNEPTTAQGTGPQTIKTSNPIRQVVSNPSPTICLNVLSLCIVVESFRKRPASIQILASFRLRISSPAFKGVKQEQVKMKLTSVCDFVILISISIFHLRGMKRELNPNLSYIYVPERMQMNVRDPLFHNRRKI